MKLIYLVALLLFVNSAYAITEITEIMYNPAGSDNNNEYLEIYSDEIFNFTDFTIEDSSSQDILTLLYYFPSNYSLIVEEDFNYSNINASIYSAGKTIGNGLNNDNDILILKNITKPIAVESYSNQLGADGNNKSLCKINLILKECSPSPGSENLIYENLTLLINELLPDPEGYDNASMPDGEWLELFNYGSENIETEGLILKDESGKEIIISKANVINSTIIHPNNYLVIYMNSFSGFLNNDGYEKIYLISNDSVIGSFSYSHTSESLSWSRFNNSFIKTVPSPGEPNILDQELLESKIRISSKNLKAKIGTSFKVKLYVQKGDTTKNSVKLYVLDNNNERISKETSFNIYHKFTNTTIVLPIQMNSKCNIPTNETHTLVVSGLSQKDEIPIEIEPNKELCKSTNKTILKEPKKSTKKPKNKPTEKNINTPKITGNVVYESSEIKAGKASFYIFVSSLIGIIIALTLRI